MEEFKTWVEQYKKTSFPVEPELFDSWLQEFAIYNQVDDTKTTGRKDLTRHNFGFKDGKLVYFKIKFKAEGIQDKEHDKALQIYDYWNNQMDQVNQ